MTSQRPGEPRSDEDVQVEGGCPTCGGAVAARFTRSMVWAWCGPCRRLSRPVLVAGADGARLFHPAAAA
ncbi:MAG: hypothetical protein IPO09_00765 [Anaeromyxobacter sp.]|nr:hypothetical protein [Anaeromyxobacter sp.]MBL0278300.1 hypothetical protein [Anaeromyxobacter sp.]